MQAYPIPGVNELAQYNVNRANAVEAVCASLYDTVAYAQAGQTQLQFFQTPAGQSSKTLADTNMTLAGTLPAPQNFLIRGVEVFFYPGALPGLFGAQAVPTYVNDVYKFYKQGAWLELSIGSKTYLQEAPLQKFPPSVGLSGFSAAADQTTIAAASQTLVNYASAGGEPYAIYPPLLLTPSQNFKITLNWPTAVALSVAGTIVVSLKGILYRNSQ